MSQDLQRGAPDLQPVTPDLQQPHMTGRSLKDMFVEFTAPDKTSPNLGFLRASKSVVKVETLTQDVTADPWSSTLEGESRED